jgi:DNA-binding MurR/RpiR family transcriptional regulator
MIAHRIGLACFKTMSGRRGLDVDGEPFATGMGLADTLLTMRRGDAVVLMDYGRVYREVEVTLDRANAVGIPVILLTDTLGLELAERIDLVLQAPRGRTGDLGSVVSAMAALEALNDLRAQIVGYRVDLDPNLANNDHP